MPRKRKGADLSRNTSKSRTLRNRRSERTEDQIQQENIDARVRMAQLRQEKRTNDQQRQQFPRLQIHTPGKALNIGDKFPNFQAETNVGKINFYDWMETSWAILFSHPADYTPVCTTELARVQALLPEFVKRNIKPIALSCDTAESHNGWISDIKSFGNLPSFDYPIIADSKRELAVMLNMLDKDELDKQGIPLTCRAVFIIDEQKKLRLSILYPATTGRNFDEILRVIDSLQLTQNKSVATPADWKQGQACMVLPTIKSEEIDTLFPAGVEIIPVPSGKEYLRKTPQP